MKNHSLEPPPLGGVKGFDQINSLINPIKDRTISRARERVLNSVSPLPFFRSIDITSGTLSQSPSNHSGKSVMIGLHPLQLTPRN